MTLSLAGQTVLVTRAADQAGALAERLREAGATVVEAAAIQVVPPADPGPLERAMSQLDAFDWLLVTSPNGARAVAERVAGRWPRQLQVGAVGPGTAEVIRAAGGCVALVPTRADAEGLAAALTEAAPLAGRRVLLARGDLAGVELPVALAHAGAEVTTVVAYRTLGAPIDAAGLTSRIAAGEIGWVAVMSGSAYRHLAGAVGPETLKRLQVASIGPKTSAVVRELGGTVAVEAAERSVEALVRAIGEAVANNA